MHRSWSQNPICKSASTRVWWCAPPLYYIADTLIAPSVGPAAGYESLLAHACMHASTTQGTPVQRNEPLFSFYFSHDSFLITFGTRHMLCNIHPFAKATRQPPLLTRISSTSATHR